MLGKGISNMDEIFAVLALVGLVAGGWLTYVVLRFLQIFLRIAE